MDKVVINIRGKNTTAFATKRPKGYRISSGIIGGDNDTFLEDMITAITDAGYTIIKSEMQSSPWGPVPTVYFK